MLKLVSNFIWKFLKDIMFFALLCLCFLLGGGRRGMCYMCILCVSVRARARVSVCVCACACVSVRVYECMCVCVCACVCVCMRARAGGRTRRLCFCLPVTVELRLRQPPPLPSFRSAPFMGQNPLPLATLRLLIDFILPPPLFSPFLLTLTWARGKIQGGQDYQPEQSIVSRNYSLILLTS